MIYICPSLLPCAQSSYVQIIFAQLHSSLSYKNNHTYIYIYISCLPHPVAIVSYVP